MSAFGKSKPIAKRPILGRIPATISHERILAAPEPVADIALAMLYISWSITNRRRKSEMLPLAFLLLSAATDSAPQIPSRRTVERLETALSVLNGLQSVGLPTDFEAFNRASRIRVRSATCKPIGKGKAECTYLVDQCGFGKVRWCQRTSVFLYDPYSGDPFRAVKGWRIDRPDPD